MRTSRRGIELIKKFEGFQPRPYRCPAGHLTIGYGTRFYPTIGVGRREVLATDPEITEPIAEWILREALREYEEAVLDRLHVELSQSQFDALVSFAYNVGTGNFARSTLARMVASNPNDPGIRAQFARWVYANIDGDPELEKVPGLIKRRAAEADLYFSSDKD